MPVGTEPSPNLSGVPGSSDPPRSGNRLLTPLVMALAALALAASAAALIVAITDDEAGATQAVSEIEDLPPNASGAAGEIFSVTGTVQRAVGPGFVLRDDDASVLVMPAQEGPVRPAIAAGRKVLVTGALREVQDVDFQELYGVRFDEGLLDPFEPGRVLVATTIDPTANAS